MTICVSIKVPDGLVLAADSMSSYPVLNPATQQWDIVQSYSFANKVIQLGSAPICALAWGVGSVQKRSMENLINEFSRGHLGSPPNPTVPETAAALAKFIQADYEQEFPDSQKRPILGFLIGGYDAGSPFAQQWAFELPSTPGPVELLPPIGGKPNFGVQWFGQVDALQRLVYGYDPKIVQALKAKGLDATKVDEFFSPQNLFGLKIPYEIVFDGMPLQDAVDLAAYLVHVVKGRFRFVVAPKVYGAPRKLDR